MKIHIRWVILLTMCTSTLAQQIDEAEYFFDSDPGQGNGIPLSVEPSDTPRVNQAVSVAALADGLHRICLRYRDELSRWSLADCRLFYLVDVTPPDTSDNLIAAEYFFDSDPGQGNAQAISVTAGSAPSVSIPVNVSALTPGLHRLCLRYRDEFGRWSIADSRLFYINAAPSPQPYSIAAAEYFYNMDPGAGNGHALSITPGDNPVISGEISLSGLAPGLHRFFLRYRNDRNWWSIADCRLFSIIDPAGNIEIQTLAGAEYFINVDPGWGHGIPFTLPLDGIWDDTLENVADSVIGIPLGVHVLGLRYRDNRGVWSPIAADTFCVGPVVTACPDSLRQSLVLRWQTGPEAISFTVRRAETVDGPYSAIGTTTNSFFCDQGILNTSAPRNYYYIMQTNPELSSFRFPRREPDVMAK
jgi:hypothetical protein